MMRVFIVIAVVLLLSLPEQLVHTALAVVPVGEVNIDAQVNVPYAIQYGFGSYNAGALSVDTIRIPIPLTFYLGDEKESPRLKLITSLGYSYTSFETYLLGPKVSAAQDYLFGIQQVALELPLTRIWTVKPYISAGLGWAFNGYIEYNGKKDSMDDGHDFLYETGIANLFEFPVGRFHFSFGSRLGWAHVLPITEGAEMGLSTFQNGIEIKHPLGFGINGDTLDIAGSFIHYNFFPAAEFTVPGERPIKVSNQFEFGGTIGFDKPKKFWIIENPRIGVSYRFGDGITGIRLNLGFPF